MEKEADLRKQITSEYRGEVERFVKYIPWLEQKAGAQVASIYKGENITAHSVAFPVYDATLMGFVKEMSKTKFMDRNYPYVYSRNGIHTVKDEKNAIAHAGVRDMNILCGIMSKYVLGGMTKGTLWSKAVEEGIFLALLQRMKEIVEYWDTPLDMTEK